MDYSWLFVQILPSIGFILALALMSHILRERRPPASTLAWLMAIVFIPYLGVPLYLMFGGRKMLNKADAKPELFPYEQEQRQLHDFFMDNEYMLASGNGIFPPSAPNRIKLLSKGEQAFQTILDLIQQAEYSIFIATFILGKDKTGKAIIQALAQKASQGVKVCLLLDALGSVKISKAFLSPLAEAGGRAAFFMPMIHLPFRGRANLRNHRKMLICDDKIAVIGGMNLAAEYMGPNDMIGRWRDLSLIVEGPVIHQITEVFDSDWKFASKAPFNDNSIPVHATVCDTVGVTQLVVSGPDVRNDSLRNAILTQIFRAKQRIWIVSPYFVPDEMLVESLCIAIGRNIDVSIIIPQKSNHRLADIVREGYLTRVQEAGAKVLLYEPSMLHAKAILVDDSLAMVGSANMDMRSILLNYEIALCLYDSNEIEQIESWMQDIKRYCFKREQPSKHSFGFIESVGRLLAPLL